MLLEGGEGAKALTSNLPVRCSNLHANLFKLLVEGGDSANALPGNRILRGFFIP